MKNYNQIVLCTIIVILFVLGLLVWRQDQIQKNDTPYATPTPTFQYEPTACYNDDGVEVECKG